MKVYTLDQARERLGELCDDAQQGETVLLDRQGETFVLQPTSGFFPTDEIDWDDAGLESGMLGAVTGVHRPLEPGELRARGEAVLERLRGKSPP